MNYLAIDYGSKRIGLAYSTMGIISTLPPIPNNSDIFVALKKVVSDYSINHVYVGLSEGKFAKKTTMFVDKLSDMLELSIETVEESVSTIEAEGIFKSNKHLKKNYKQQIDSLAAAVILRRVIN